MPKTSTFLQRHSLIIGIILMFALTWPIDLANSGVLPIQVPFLVYLFLGWGIVIASLVMTAATLGGRATLALLKRYLIWRVGIHWYLVALFMFPAIVFSAVAINAALTGSPIDFSGVFAHRIFGADANLIIYIVPFLLVDAVSNGEEIGWRGYVLPRLQARYSALIATLILGVIWSLWHIPKFLALGNTSPFVWFFAMTLANTVLYTWLYNNTGGSLLLVTLFHASANTAGVFLPVANTVDGANVNTLLYQIAITAVIAVAVILIFGATNFSRTKARQSQD